MTLTFSNKSIGDMSQRPRISLRAGVSSVHGTDDTDQRYLSNGLLHPRHMVRPGQEGYRTPAGEDFGEHGYFVHGITERLAGRPHRSSSTLTEVTDRTSRMSESDSSTQLRGEDRRSPISTAGHDLPERSEDDEQAKPGGSETTGDSTGMLSWRKRLKHFTWAFFTSTMATGGIANVLWHVPFRFNGIYQIGCAFFLLNVVLFFINVVCISLRFYFHPATLRNSFLHPTESLFAPAAVVSFGTILLNISQYGTGHVGKWLDITVMVLFWVDVALAVVASFGIYLLFWSTQTFTISTMTPVWIFPAYPLLIIGSHASVLSSTLDPEQSAQILVGGFTAQGIGFLVSMMIYSAYIYRLMTQKLPFDKMRPGMFVSVGPSAFTASALSNMASNAQRTWQGTDFMGNGDLAAMVLRVIGEWTALWLWGLALWFFFIAVGAHYSILRGRKDFPFAMTWFSFVFPQTALVNSTFAIGRAFKIWPLQIIGCVMTVILVAVWFFVCFMMVKAICLKQILWPQKGEDKNEGGFRDDGKDESMATGASRPRDLEARA